MGRRDARAARPDRSPGCSRGGLTAEQSLRHVHPFARMLELELDAVAVRPRPDPHLSPERRGERILGGAERVLEVGVDDDRSRLLPAPRAVLELARAALRLPHRPSGAARIAGEPQPLRLLLDEEEGATVTAGQLTALDHREHLVRELEHAYE